MDRIIAYTDGSALGNGQDGCACGWAYKILMGGQEITGNGSAMGETNNRMEMTAVLEAMRSIPIKDAPVEIYSDSRYVVETMNGHFSMKANKDLWRKLNAERMKFNSIRFVWVKGHDKNQHNNDVDRLAVEAAKKAQEAVGGGVYLDNHASLLGLKRRKNETDSHLRKRCLDEYMREAGANENI